MKHFINLKTYEVKDLKKIIKDAKRRKLKEKNTNTLDLIRSSSKGKILIQMFEKPSLRTRLSFYLAIRQLGGGTINFKDQRASSWQRSRKLS